MNAVPLPEQLPGLRAELRLDDAGVDYNNNQTWIIHDPHTNHFYQIGWLEFEIIKRWGLGNPEKIIAAVNTNTSLHIDTEDLLQTFQFLTENQLLRQSYKSIKTTFEQKQKTSIWQALLHNYLFFRLPLVAPDRFLTRSYPYIAWLFQPATLFFMLVLGLSGLWLAHRQWDQFINSFSGAMSAKGMVVLAIAIILSKVVHELGHAYQCKRYGLRVPSMGIAFMLMWPVAYTDTADSWRLASAKQRLNIALGGIWLEFYFAVLALLLWSFLPDGVLRQTTFFIAGISFLLSITINISPFLRFDGYHIVSDLLSMRNLQTRSFALTRWWIRRLLFNWEEAGPENLSTRKKRWLILYALGTWVYRFFLFLGIALLVYHFFFKILGIILFAAEIYLFIIKPIGRELLVWWKQRHMIQWNRHTLITSIAATIVMLAIFVPWNNKALAPATLSYQHQSIFTPMSAHVDRVLVQKNQMVNKGQVLFELSSPKLDYDIEVAKQKRAEVKASMHTLAASQQRQEYRQVLHEQLDQIDAELAGLYRQQERLKVRAPISGRVTDLLASLQTGNWLKQQQQLATITNPQTTQINAYLDSQSLHKIQPGKAGVFIPENAKKTKVNAQVTKINFQDTNALAKQPVPDRDAFLTDAYYISEAAYNAIRYGGQIKTSNNDNNELVPDQSIHLVHLTPRQPVALNRIERGTVVFNVAAESIANKLWHQVAGVFIRETGF